jgi:hypothetical protein
MRASGSSELEAALNEYARAVASALSADVAAGAEVELELGATRGRAQTPFYSCRPLTERFIAEREAQLERLPGHAAAVAALASFDGLDRYLAGRAGSEGGLRAEDLRRNPDRAGARVGVHARARVALEMLIDDVFAGQTEFELRPERLAAALARLERAELASAPEAITIVATLHGMTIASPEVKLTRGLTIATPDALGWAPGQALVGIHGRNDDAPEHLLVALTCEEPARDLEELTASGVRTEIPCEASSAELTIAHARDVLRDLLRALRLFGDGRVTLGPLAWVRPGGEDAWSTVPLGSGGRPHGMLVISADQEDELRAFCNLVSRRAPTDNELAWALRRFELGCERAGAYEGLSDHLLALRALLEPEGPASGLLAGRVAALCATPERRAKLIDRMIRAQRLERAAIAGTAKESAAGLACARDVAEHLRALLRDVICGHLTPDLARLADQLLTESERESPDAPAEDASAAQAAQHAAPVAAGRHALVEA